MSKEPPLCPPEDGCEPCDILRHAPHDSTRCACGHEEREHGTMLEGDGPCLGNGYRCECKTFQLTEPVGAVDFAAAGVMERVNAHQIADTPSERVEQAREAVAKMVYAAMQLASEEGKRHPWQDGGNSTMQDIARRKADEILAAVRAEIREMVEGMEASRAHPDDYYYTLCACGDDEKDGRGGYDVMVDRAELLALLSDREAR